MTGTIVLGLVPSPSDAESAVNSLTEEGFKQRDVSVITANGADARAIIGDYGPLRGVDAASLGGRLASLGVHDSGTYADAVAGGAALLAVTASSDTESAIADTLRSANAQRVLSVREAGS